MKNDDFDLHALFVALDDQRQARRLTWTAAAREINAARPARAVRPVATSTMTRLRTKALAEADGVLQMLRWLGRAPERFAGATPADGATALPDARAGDILRFDPRKLYDELAQAREAGGLTWPQLASQFIRRSAY